MNNAQIFFNFFISLLKFRYPSEKHNANLKCEDVLMKSQSLPHSVTTRGDFFYKEIMKVRIKK